MKLDSYTSSDVLTYTDDVTKKKGPQTTNSDVVTQSDDATEKGSTNYR